MALNFKDLRQRAPTAVTVPRASAPRPEVSGLPARDLSKPSNSQMFCSAQPRVLRASICVLALIIALPSPLHAAPPPTGHEKLLATMASAAKKAFDDGAFQHAGELYLDYFGQEHAPIALFSAARSFHLAGLIDKADELYKQFSDIRTAEAGQVQKAAAYRLEIAERRADRKAEEAARAEQAGHYLAAAELWADARRDAPTRWSLLARQGRATQLAGQQQQASVLFRLFLDSAPTDAADRPAVLRWQASVEPPVAVEPAKAATGSDSVGQPTVVQLLPPVMAAPVRRPAEPKPIAAYAAVALGSAMEIAGLLTYLAARGSSDDLVSRLAQVDKNGLVVGVTDQQARTKSSDIAREKTISASMALLGAAGLGLGIWLWHDQRGQIGTPASAQLLLTDKGIALCGQF